MTARQITAALKQAHRHNAAAKAEAIKAELSQQHLAQPAPVAAAYAATVQATATVLITLNEQIDQLETQVVAHFHEHPDAEIYLSQPGIGNVNGPRVLAEFGDDPGRYVARSCTQMERTTGGKLIKRQRRVSRELTVIPIVDVYLLPMPGTAADTATSGVSSGRLAPTHQRRFPVLFVTPSARGTGTARELLDAVFAEAARRGAHILAHSGVQRPSPRSPRPGRAQDVLHRLRALSGPAARIGLRKFPIPNCCRVLPPARSASIAV
jgi:hypothetical protein